MSASGGPQVTNALETEMKEKRAQRQKSGLEGSKTRLNVLASPGLVSVRPEGSPFKVTRPLTSVPEGRLSMS